MAELLPLTHLASLVSEADPENRVTEVGSGLGKALMSIATALCRATLTGHRAEKWFHQFPAPKVPKSRVRPREVWSGP